MAFPNLIRIEGLTTDTNGNGLYATIFTSTWNYGEMGYGLTHDEFRWCIRPAADYSSPVAVSDACANTVSPLSATWGETEPIDYIRVVGGVFGVGYDFYNHNSVNSFRDWVANEDVYYLGWTGSRWEISDSESVPVVYSASGFTSNPYSLTASTVWSDDLVSSAVHLFSYTEHPTFENVDVAINSAKELQSIGLNAFTLDGNYIQTANIDLNGFGNFSPIGYDDLIPFTGTYNGGGFEIQNISNNATGTNFGLFGIIEGGTVENVKLRSCYFAGLNYTACLAGRVVSSSVIRNCSATGELLSDGYYVGGLIGACEQATVDRCWADVAVTQQSAGNRSHLGGFAGSVSGTSTITDCYALGRVTGHSTTDGVGGFVGTVYNTAVIKNCYALGLATGDLTTGQFNGAKSHTPTFTNCYWISDEDGSVSDSGSRLSTTEARILTSYLLWDFRSIWNIDQSWITDPSGAINDGYPYLDPRGTVKLLIKINTHRIWRNRSSKKIATR